MRMGWRMRESPSLEVPASHGISHSPFISTALPAVAPYPFPWTSRSSHRRWTCSHPGEFPKIVAVQLPRKGGYEVIAPFTIKHFVFDDCSAIEKRMWRLMSQRRRYDPQRFRCHTDLNVWPRYGKAPRDWSSGHAKASRPRFPSKCSPRNGRLLPVNPERRILRHLPEVIFTDIFHDPSIRIMKIRL